MAGSRASRSLQFLCSGWPQFLDGGIDIVDAASDPIVTSTDQIIATLGSLTQSVLSGLGAPTPTHRFGSDKGETTTI